MSTCCTKKYNRTVIRGDSDRFKVTFLKKTTDDKGREATSPIDITGWLIKFTVRKDVPESTIITDEDAVITINAVNISPKEGIAMVYVTSEDTNTVDPGDYYYDIQYIRPSNEYGIHPVRSIRRAKYTVIGDITRDNMFLIDCGEAVEDTEYADTHIDGGLVEDRERTLIDGGTPTTTEFTKTIEGQLADIEADCSIDGGFADTVTFKAVTEGGNAKSETAVFTPVTKTSSNYEGLTEDEDDADDGYTI